MTADLGPDSGPVAPPMPLLAMQGTGITSTPINTPDAGAGVLVSIRNPIMVASFPLTVDQVEPFCEQLRAALQMAQGSGLEVAATIPMDLNRAGRRQRR